MIVLCDRKQCLNNRRGRCIAECVTYKGRCVDYVTAHDASHHKGGRCHKVNGKFKPDSAKVFK
ncbi:hypothetical protein [Veillonella sp.]|uniref:hypothetical protein n=1 Tax=Veillonella sp. TaxID=1926307 RepID=UPI0025EB7E9B|nr:hypothetical protein [Veillonella sp.]